MSDRKMAHRPPPRPDRVRRIDRGFAVIPNRFLHEGFFASLGHVERSLYFFLVIAGDRDGVSFYGPDRICATLEISLDDYLAARNSLITKDLVAFDGARLQVKSFSGTSSMPASESWPSPTLSTPVAAWGARSSGS
jgi:hypothetical protein